MFYDIVNSEPEHPLHLHEKNDFEEKKHEEEFIEREDLICLEEKTEEMGGEKEKEKEVVEEKKVE